MSSSSFPLKVRAPWPSVPALVAEIRRQGLGILLDSAMEGHPESRFSIGCVRPRAILSWEDAGRATLTVGNVSRSLEQPKFFLEQWLKNFSPEERGFWGGAVGFTSYESYGLHQSRGTAKRFPGLPQAWWLLVDTGLVLDHRSGEAWAFSWGMEDDLRTLCPRLAQRRVAELLEYLPRISEPALDGWENREPQTSDLLHYRPRFEAVQSAIARGDFYQVNLSKPFFWEKFSQPVELYRHLREAMPAPNMAYVDWGAGQILSASPELLYRQEGDVVTSVPIKGTRTRLQNPLEDQRLREALWESEKDAAELLMIVDLIRNDLGKICRYGSVQVRDPKYLETYSYVHHLMSRVEGRLRPGVGALDVLWALSPGGSITGAPKLKAMEWIDALEEHARGIYTGSIGYFGFGGDACWSLAIRTALVDSAGLHYWAGSGIVADSEADLEHDEILHKAAGILYALTLGGRSS